MPLPNSGRYPDFSSQCFTFARWFHQHGLTWSGTPSELSSELINANVADEGDPTFVTGDTVFAFLEANAEALERMGVSVAVKKPQGQPKNISLRVSGRLSTASTNRLTVVKTNELPDHPDIDLRHAPADTPPTAPAETEKLPDTVPTLAVEKHTSPLQAMDLKPSRLLPQPVKAVTTPAPSTQRFAHEGSSITFHTLDEDRGENRRWRWHLIIGIFLFLALVILAMVMLLSAGPSEINSSNNSALSSPEQTVRAAPGSDDPQTTSAATAAQTEPTSDPQTHPSAARATTPATPVPGSSGVDELIRQASAEHSAAAQYQLGIRYQDGRGVKQDKVAAYSWLVLAAANGDQRGYAALNALTPQLSGTELQQVRLKLGESYMRGIGVPADFVIAHSWFALAEVAGSAEGTLRKKQLESRMTADQIERAKTRTTAWLKSH